MDEASVILNLGNSLANIQHSSITTRIQSIYFQRAFFEGRFHIFLVNIGIWFSMRFKSGYLAIQSTQSWSILGLSGFSFPGLEDFHLNSVRVCEVITQDVRTRSARIVWRTTCGRRVNVEDRVLTPFEDAIGLKDNLGWQNGQLVSHTMCLLAFAC